MNVKKLQDAINANGISKVMLAEKCQVTRMTIDNILAGKDFKVSTLEALAAVLNVSPAVFFDTQGSSAVASGNNSIAAVNSLVGSTDYMALWVEAQQLLREKDALITKLVNKLCTIEDTQ